MVWLFPPDSLSVRWGYMIVFSSQSNVFERDMWNNTQVSPEKPPTHDLQASSPALT